MLRMSATTSSRWRLGMRRRQRRQSSSRSFSARASASIGAGDARHSDRSGPCPSASHSIRVPVQRAISMRWYVLGVLPEGCSQRVTATRCTPRRFASPLWLSPHCARARRIRSFNVGILRSPFMRNTIQPWDEGVSNRLHAQACRNSGLAYLPYSALIDSGFANVCARVSWHCPYALADGCRISMCGAAVRQCSGGPHVRQM